MRFLTILAALVIFWALAVSPAFAGKSPHRYSPKAGAHCRKHYKRVKHRKRVFCVKRAAKSQRPEDVKLHAHLDPAFTRDPLNPFRVTYAYSASATEESVGRSSAPARASDEAPAQLPSGVLAFYSDGSLECAVNVGGAVMGGECPVTYQALGQHRVTTIYTSGEESATETEIETIDPLSTLTNVTIDYYDLGSGPEQTLYYTHCTGSPGLNSEECEYRMEWRLGVVSATASSTPAGLVKLQCLGGAWCPAFAGSAISGTVSADVVLVARTVAHGHYEAVSSSPTCEEVKEAATDHNSGLDRWEYPTSISLQASPISGGYVPDRAMAQLGFSPTLPC